MYRLNLRKYLIAASLCLLATPALKAQTMGDKAMLVNKTWRFVAMKCPQAMNNAANPDEFVHYYYTLTLKPANSQNMNYGEYVKLNRDLSDNPVERGTYSITSDDVNGVRIVFKPNKSKTTKEYRVETVLANYLTLINLSDNDKCKIAYAVCP